MKNSDYLSNAAENARCTNALNPQQSLHTQNDVCEPLVFSRSDNYALHRSGNHPPLTIRLLTSDAQARRAVEIGTRWPRKKPRSRRCAPLAWLFAFALACTLLALPHNAFAQGATGWYQSGVSPAPVFRNTTPTTATVHEDNVFVMQLTTGVGGHLYDPLNPTGDGSNITFEIVSSTYHDWYSNVRTGQWGDNSHFKVLNTSTSVHGRGAILFKTPPDYENPTDRRLIYRAYESLTNPWLPTLGRPQGPRRLRSHDRDNQYWLGIRATITDAQGATHPSYLSIPVNVIKDVDRQPPVFRNTVPIAVWVRENQTRVTEFRMSGSNADIYDLANPAGHGNGRTIILGITRTWGDGPKFSILNSPSGAHSRGTLLFLTAPDYENPTDTRIVGTGSELISAATDNVYLLQITATVTDRDGNLHTSTHEMGVTVTNDFDSAPQKPINLRQTAVGSGAGESGRTVTFKWNQPLLSTQEDAPSYYKAVVREVSHTGVIDSPAQSHSYIVSRRDRNFWLYNRSSAPELTARIVLPRRGIFMLELTPWNKEEGTVSDRILLVTNGPGVSPVFSVSSFSNPENSTPSLNVTATDADPEDKVVGYALSTTFGDAARFQINTTSGALSFRQQPNYEDPLDILVPSTSVAADNAYLVKVTATSRVPLSIPGFPGVPLFGVRQANTEAELTITVTDVAETPGTPAAPAVVVLAQVDTNARNRLGVSWRAPTNTGPAINDYDVQYRDTAVLPFAGVGTDVTFTGAGTSLVFTRPNGNPNYQFRVKAKSPEGDSPWSNWGSVTINTPPVFSSAATATVAEHTTTSFLTLTATDADATDTQFRYTITGGVDAAQFTLNSTTGALSFTMGPDYENAADLLSTQPANAASNNVYLVKVTVTSGQAPRLATVSQMITVTVTDATEPPGTPAAPTVTLGSVNSALALNVTWTAPSTTGPAIDDYDVRSRVKVASGTPNAWSDAGHTGTATSRTLTGVLNNNDYEVQVRAHNAEGWSPWSASGEENISVNTAPRFTSGTSFTIPENSSRTYKIGTITAVDDDPLDGYVTYSIGSLSGSRPVIDGGADKTRFKMFSNGQVFWQHLVDLNVPPPDFENPIDAASTTGQPTATAGDNIYSIVIVAESRGIASGLTWAERYARRKSTAQTITITVTDVDEPPGAVSSLALVPHSTLGTSLVLSWDAPITTGKPPITGYDVQYRKHGTTDAWGDAGHTGTGATLTLNNLAKSIRYEAQVRAKNHEGTGPWASTTGEANAPPAFTPTSFTVAENQYSVGTFTATDSDSQDTYFDYALQGADRLKFLIDGQGRLETRTTRGWNYENPASTAGTNTYTLTVVVSSSNGPNHAIYTERLRSTSQTVTVTVTDVAEPPNKPRQPTVSAVAASNSKLDVSWRAPYNLGPAIKYYNLRYRKGTTGSFTELNANILAGTTTRQLTGLLANSSYEVQVRAVNGEGIGPWSDSGTGRTNASGAGPLAAVNNVPRFTSTASFSIVENTTAVGTVTAVDADALDNVTGYTLSGADASKFQITTGGALTFKTAPDYETPGSTDSENLYVVTVTASSGTGDRVRTASQVVSVTVTDVPPSAPPAPPTVVPASGTSLAVTWLAPSTTAGYPVTDYDVEYSGNDGTWIDVPHTGTSRSTTISSLSANINYAVQVRATSSEGTSIWSAYSSGVTNVPPAVTVESLYTVVENSPPTTTIATFTGTDLDRLDGTPTLELDGGDERRFSLAPSGALTFTAAPNFERPTDVLNSSPADPADHSARRDNDYSLRLKVTSGTGARLQSAYSPWFIVRVTNVPPPEKPAAPSVTAATASPTQLTVTWTAPSTTSGYPITDYDVQYRSGTSGSYTRATHIGTSRTKVLANLGGGTSYQARVRARNSEGVSSWSDATTQSTAANAAPTFSTTAFSVNEGVSAVGTVVATDADAGDTVTSYEISGGADSAKFSIVETGTDAGKLTFVSLPDYENPADVAHSLPAPADGAANNVYIVYISATSGTGEREDNTWQRIAVTVTDVNERPVLAPITLSAVPENTTAVVTVSATDPDKTSSNAARDAITYSLSGVDSGQFDITSPGGVLTFRTAPDYENPGDVVSTSPTNAATDNEYVVVVTATSAAGTARALSAQARTLIVEVSDANEPPSAPPAVSVTPVTGYSDKLDVAWTAPSNTGKPAIAHYHVRYGVDGTSVSFTEKTGTADELAADATLTTRLTGLSASTKYAVQVRADNAEGEGTWSTSGKGTTNADSVLKPPFRTVTSDYSVAENTTAVTTVEATDTTGATVTYSIPDTDAEGGVDRAKFSITASGGVLTFAAAPDYENPTDVESTTPANAAGNNEYIVTVKATARNRGSSTRTLTVTVTDVTEKPGKPTAPTVTAASATPAQLSVAWAEPTNTGPAITDYDVHYRTGAPVGTWQDASVTGTTRTTTLTGLTQGTAYEVRVRATSNEGTGPWSDEGDGTTAVNVAPSFSTTTFSLAENTTAVGTVSATDSDAGDSVTRYQISGGADSSKFTITETGTNIGKLVFAAAPDFEATASAAGSNVYKVQITVTSGAGARVAETARLFTISVTDATEPPIAPAAPTVSGVSATPTSLGVSWSAPLNTGKPAISGYKLQYRQGNTGNFTLAAGTVTGTSTTLRGLTKGTAYQVRVRARNAEGDSPWSAAGSGSTAVNAVPSFSTTTFSIAENETAVGTVSATDSDASDSITRYQISGGADSSKFTITETGTNKGKLAFRAAPDFEATASAAGNNTYKVALTATSGTGARVLTGTAQTFTITVTDATEPPIAPAAPTVSGVSATPTSLGVSWSAPLNTGKPAISGYKLRYRQGNTGNFAPVTGTFTGTSTTLTGLTKATAYQVQVRARNAEGDSPWSAAGSGSTAVNAVPSFSTTTFSLAENETAVGTVSATDSDTGDSITRYRISGGADSSKFTITETGANKGKLVFAAAPDFEATASSAGSNVYKVQITVTSGAGARVAETARLFTITVTDASEPPIAPAAPTVSGVSATPTSLGVSWSAPLNTGKPAISGYKLQYRQGSTGTFTLAAGTVTGTSTTLRGLTKGTAYQVRVRARNAEGDSPWSATGSGSTAVNAVPSFSTTTFSIVENATAVGTVSATDSDASDSITRYRISGGADNLKFSITETGANIGKLAFRAAPDYEATASAAGNNTYKVEVTATSGTGARAAQKAQVLTVTVTNATEKPLVPTGLKITATALTTLTAGWSAPNNAGRPALSGYDVQYRQGNSGGWTAAAHTGVGTSVMLSSLTQNTGYQVRVLAKNADGLSAWTPAVTGTTAADNAPSFTSSTSFSLNENTTAVGTVVATDADAGDSITGYQVTGGADSAKFSVTNTGALSFKAAPDYENPADAAHTTPAPADAARNNVYIVEVSATGGADLRRLSTAQRIAVTVADVNEPPSAPTVTGVTAVTGYSDKLDVTWTAPSNTGKPAIAHYHVRYGVDGTPVSFTGTVDEIAASSLTTRLTGLSASTAYVVQVRADNDEGDGAWSGSSTGRTNADSVLRPQFDGTDTYSVAENTTAVTTVTARDATNADVTYSIPTTDAEGGVDRAKFSITTGGVLTFATAPNYENPTDVVSTTPANAAGNNEYIVKVKATARNRGSSTRTLTVTVTDVNEGPVLSPITLSAVPENTTAVATVSATDPDKTSSNAARDAITYSLSGVDSGQFDITSPGGVLTFRTAPDYENPGDVVSTSPTNAATDNEYVVVVTATSAAGTARALSAQARTLIVEVSDANEPPSAPPAVSVTAVTGYSDKLDVTWTAPSNTGKPAIAHYHVRYGVDGTPVSFTGTVDELAADATLTTRLTGLSPSTAYAVQVRADNDEGDGAWSGSGTGTTNDASALLPRFGETDATYSVAENETAVTTVTARDATNADVTFSIPGTDAEGGVDRAKFSITASGGVLTFAAAPDYENPTDVESTTPANAAGNNEYIVKVKATASGRGNSTRTLTVTVTDVTEKPGKPDAPTVTAVSAKPTELSVTWTAPTNTGPAITDYDVHYRTKGPPAGEWQDASFTGATRTTTLTGLTQGTAYEVRVSATSTEGTGPWSDEGDGTTAVNVAPSFSTTTFSVAENTTAVSTVSATDSDAGDSVTRYRISGGADSSKFTITETGTNIGKLVFAAAPDFEATASAAGTNVYKVQITVTSGAGARVAETARLFTITVTDADEPPSAPGQPMVTAVTGYVDRLKVTWTAPPSDPSKPAIDDYDVQYRKSSTNPVVWQSWTHTGTGTSTTLTGLSPSTEYTVQVRANNAEGESTWSGSGTGTTNDASALLPRFGETDTTYSVAENTTAVTTVTARDATNADVTFSIPGTDAEGGVDRAKFSITTGGVLTFAAAPNYENPTDVESTTPANAAGNNEYIVKVKATASGRGSSTRTLTVTVTDVTEKPGKPDAPTVSGVSATPTQLSVTWTAPTNTGPAISGYKLQYRQGSTGNFTLAAGTVTGTSTTLRGLTKGTAYQVQVRASNAEGTGPWSDSGSGSTATNADVVFASTGTGTGSVDENSAITTNILTLNATDADAGDSISYAVSGGVDAGAFTIAGTNKLRFTTSPNHESPTDVQSTSPANAAANNEYIVVVKATSGSGERESTAKQTLTISVNDVDEPPDAPTAPSVSGATLTTLKVTWTAPSNSGKPAIDDYDVQYGKSGTTPIAWQAQTHTGTSTTTTLTGLDTGTTYQVQVRARNDEGDSPWSASGTGMTAVNNGPAFTTSTRQTIVENDTAIVTLAATDTDPSDAIIGYEIVGGVDEALFELDTSNQLLFKNAPNYEAPGDAASTEPTNAANNNEYLVVVKVTSGENVRALSTRQTFTITVTDEDGEAPGKPDAPTVSESTLTTLKVAWTAPANKGPAISDYDVQYRTGTGSFTDANYAGTGTSTTLTGLATGTTYQVQVRAKNAEGTSPWSASGEGTTINNNGPDFSSIQEEQLVPENKRAVVPLVATDPDPSDTTVTYAVSGGTDRNLFEIESSTNVLRFKTAPDYENPADEGRDNEYIVEVMATSGANERALSKSMELSVEVSDVGPPGQPAMPTVSPVAGSGTRLSVTWTAPVELGPAITDYDVQYREGDTGSYRDAGHNGIDTSLTLTGLKVNTEYQAQVRAKNIEGYGFWSPLGKGTTNLIADPSEDANAPPRFISKAQPSVRENTMQVVTLVAVDDDEGDKIMGYQISGGVDAAVFTLKNGNELRFKKAPDYENPGDAESSEPANAARNNESVIEVMATSGTGERAKTVKQMLTVSITDVSGPERPAKPKVSSVAGSTTKLRVKWRAPESAGLPVSDYDVQYRATGASSWTNAKYDGTGTSTDLTGLKAKETYHVQVRARNAEGKSPWSPNGTGSPSSSPVSDEPPDTDEDEDEDGELPPDGAPAVPAIIAHKTVIINEIGNRSDDTYDWLELFNLSYEDINLKDWSISIVDKAVVHDIARDALESGDGSAHDRQFVHFETDITIPARGYLLLMQTDPMRDGHPLAGGIAPAIPIDKLLPGQTAVTVGRPSSQCYVDAGLALPDGDFLLILRDSATAEGTAENLRDIAGNYYKAAMIEAEPTLMWPLVLDVQDYSNFNFHSEEVWARANTQIDGFCENAFVQAPYTGIGYDRAVAPTDAGGKHSGTPGYANDALKTTAAALENPTSVSISEVMFAPGTVARGAVPRDAAAGALPQWIEVFNSSESEAVSLENWRLEIRNDAAKNVDARRNATLVFTKGLIIAPRQTVLLVSSAARPIKPRAVGRGLVSSEPWPMSGHLPETSVYSLYDEAAAPLGMASRADKVLSATGFSLTLKDREEQVVDVVGNFDSTQRKNAWALPPVQTRAGARVSLLRRYIDGAALDGQKSKAWLAADETHLAAQRDGEGLFYGAPSDLGTPGYRGSMLSRFEITATGAGVVLTWETTAEAATTAGFNVLRCETRDGVFGSCNDTLIPGAGTTSQPQTYTFTDAKVDAGVPYWYRLTEASFDGVEQTLATLQLSFEAADVNGDGEVNIKDLVFAAGGNGQPVQRAKKQNPDVNGDGVVNPQDVQAVLGALEAKAGAAPVHPTLTASRLQPWIDKAKQLNLPDATFQRGIRELERLAAALAIPKETALLPNYPNPFNPETWIPYDLAEAASVSLTFYDVRGRVVRTLSLGHRPAGGFRTKARAAYWDGRNEQGERVASGVYFYTFTAGDFTATGKLVVRK